VSYDLVCRVLHSPLNTGTIIPTTAG
jgi:hypothetical protein